MKKPTEAIEWLKEYGLVGTFVYQEYAQEILAYLDSIPEWPADLTRERLEELASNPPPFANNDRSDALRRLAELAPRKEKRKVTLYEFLGHGSCDRNYGDILAVKDDQPCPGNTFPWRKVGEVEIDA